MPLQAMCACTGKNEEVTGSQMLTLFIETWTFLQQYLTPGQTLDFNYNKNKRVSATVGSVHDPTAVCPHYVLTLCKHVT